MKLVYAAVICLLTASIAEEPEHTESGETFAATVGVDIRDWLPGLHTVPVRISLPVDLAAGQYAFRLGIIDPRTSAPGI